MTLNEIMPLLAMLLIVALIAWGRRRRLTPPQSRRSPLHVESVPSELPIGRWLDPIELRRERIRQRVERGEELLGRALADDILEGRLSSEDIDAICIALMMHPRVMWVRAAMIDAGND